MMGFGADNGGTKGLCLKPSVPTLLTPPSGMSFRIPRDRHVWKCPVRFDRFTWVSRVPHRADELSRGPAGLGVDGAWAVCNPVLPVNSTVPVEGGPGCARPVSWLRPAASRVRLTGSSGVRGAGASSQWKGRSLLRAEGT